MAWKDSEWKPDKADRNNGILNERERRYLISPDELDLSPAQERQIRQQIREHTMNAILDFAILRQDLEERDRERIWHDGQNPNNHREACDGEEGDLYRVRYHLPHVISFLYRFIIDEPEQIATEKFTKVVIDGITDAYGVEGYKANVTIGDGSINVTLGTEMDEITERLDEHGAESITFDELNFLYTRGVISQTEFTDMLPDVRNTDD